MTTPAPPHPRTPERLSAAADACLAAVAEHRAATGATVPPTTLHKSGAATWKLAGFGAAEVAAAEAYLIRLGFLAGGRKD